MTHQEKKIEQGLNLILRKIPSFPCIALCLLAASMTQYITFVQTDEKLDDVIKQVTDGAVAAGTRQSVSKSDLFQLSFWMSDTF